MKALLINFNLTTGVRPGGVKPNNPNLWCSGWQDLESVPAKEIRVVRDGNTVPYEGIAGITVLQNNTEINAEIAKLPIQIKIDDQTLFTIDVEQRNIKLKDMAKDPRQVLKNL